MLGDRLYSLLQVRRKVGTRGGGWVRPALFLSFCSKVLLKCFSHLVGATFLQLWDWHLTIEYFTVACLGMVSGTSESLELVSVSDGGGGQQWGGNLCNWTS